MTDIPATDLVLHLQFKHDCITTVLDKKVTDVVILLLLMALSLTTVKLKIENVVNAQIPCNYENCHITQWTEE